ncbi:NUDIX domain-containing protein [Candidatus Saccharibacteria bacterium]|nr:NUDIX domain-containing protein [Candidatus Saccharibacteria bacterium]
MHKDEMWQLYYPNGEPISGAGWDSARDNPEAPDTEIVGVAVVFVFRVNKEGVLELLWQKRAAEVSRFPGYYDISAGGHINLGESLTEAAVREAREEIGIKITPDELGLVTMRGFNKNRLAWVYAVDWSERSEVFHFDDKEVEEVQWVPFEITYDFVKKYAKPSLKKDELTFEALKVWFLQHGYLQSEG